VGPIWGGGTRGEPGLLASAYRESLKLAAERGLKTISFPSISTGVYGYPVDKAAEVALASVIAFLRDETSIREVTFVLFDSHTYAAYCHALEKLAKK
jgi:O-acetyl-ADP-ribose deacetylase (regulator of RNase III)